MPDTALGAHLLLFFFFFKNYLFWKSKIHREKRDLPSAGSLLKQLPRSGADPS